MKSEQSTRANYKSIVHNGIVVKGLLVGEGNLIISGCVEGGVELKRGELIVTPTGYIEGNVNAPRANIDGEVRGSITALRKVVIGANARILGDVVSRKLDISEGAKCNGYLQIGSTGKAPKQLKSQSM
jgi:cytoskeletal protein CcmA (bactofilin family)